MNEQPPFNSNRTTGSLVVTQLKQSIHSESPSTGMSSYKLTGKKVQQGMRGSTAE